MPSGALPALLMWPCAAWYAPARRDNLEGFWKGQFGTSHGVMVANAFYENVKAHRTEGRELGPDGQRTWCSSAGRDLCGHHR